MLFFSHVLSQLAVSAKLLCLLMVVVCEVVPSTQRSVKLFSKKSGSFVVVNDCGQVHARENLRHGDFGNLTIATLDFYGTVNIYSEQTKRVICFNKQWKLVGISDGRHPRSKSRCQFTEILEESGYNRYRSVADDRYFLAFNLRGLPIRPKGVNFSYPKETQDFVESKAGFGKDIQDHNDNNNNVPARRHHKKRHKHRGK